MGGRECSFKNPRKAERATYFPCFSIASNSLVAASKPKLAGFPSVCVCVGGHSPQPLETKKLIIYILIKSVKKQTGSQNLSKQTVRTGRNAI